MSMVCSNNSCLLTIHSDVSYQSQASMSHSPLPTATAFMFVLPVLGPFPSMSAWQCSPFWRFTANWRSFGGSRPICWRSFGAWSEGSVAIWLLFWGRPEGSCRQSWLPIGIHVWDWIAKKPRGHLATWPVWELLACVRVRDILSFLKCSVISDCLRPKVAVLGNSRACNVSAGNLDPYI